MRRPRVLSSRRSSIAMRTCPEMLGRLRNGWMPRWPSWVDSEGKLHWEKREIVIAFGRYRGRGLRELARTQPDYLQWLLESDFAQDFKGIVAGALKGEFPPPPVGNEPGGIQQSLDLPPE